MRILKRLRPDHWAWLHAKAALIAWAVLFFIYTPEKLSLALGWLLATGVSAVVIIGVGVSVVGLFMSLSNYTTDARRGVNIELAGLWVALSGPFAYCATQGYLAFGPEGDQRIALVAFAYAMCAFMIVRIVIVSMHRKRVTP